MFTLRYCICIHMYIICILFFGLTSSVVSEDSNWYYSKDSYHGEFSTNGVSTTQDKNSIPLADFPEDDRYGEIIGVVIRCREPVLSGISNLRIFTKEDLQIIARAPRMNAIKIENCGIETDTLDALADCPELLHLELVEREEVVQDIEILGNSWQMTAFSGIYKGGNVLDDEALSALAKINPDLEILRINAPLVSDETIKLLTRFKGLKELNLAQTSITSDSLKIIGQLNDLEELVISDTFISDRNLEELASLPKLERLEIDNALITDKGLETISHIPYIYSLSIANKDRRWITDEGILHLSRMDKLRCLDASGSSLSHQGLRALASCESLYYLILNDAGLCDKDLEALPPDKFAPLYLAQNDITDAGVPGIIRAMPGGHCNLSGTRVTSEGIKKLQEADILVLPTFMFEEVTARVNGSPDGVRATNEPISYPMKKTEK